MLRFYVGDGFVGKLITTLYLTDFILWSQQKKARLPTANCHVLKTYVQRISDNIGNSMVGGFNRVSVCRSGRISASSVCRNATVDSLANHKLARAPSPLQLHLYTERESHTEMWDTSITLQNSPKALCLLSLISNWKPHRYWLCLFLGDWKLCVGLLSSSSRCQ